MGPRKRKRPSTADAAGQLAARASSDNDAADSHSGAPMKQEEGGADAMDTSPASATANSIEATPVTTRDEQQASQHDTGDGTAAAQSAAEEQQQAEALADDANVNGEQNAEEEEEEEEDDADGEKDGEDDEERDSDEDGVEQRPKAEFDQPVEDTGGRRPMRAVRQKAEEEAAAKKRRRQTKRRRRDGTFMGTDEEDEDEEQGGGEAQPKQRRRKNRAAAKRDESDEESAGSAMQKAVQWVQCELCSKWRKAPADLDTSALPDQWHCALNAWDSRHASCDAAEEVQQEEETIWPGLPRHFLASSEREDFYFNITRPPFDSAHAPPYPHVQSQPVDLYMLYAHVMTHQPYQVQLDYWAPLAEQLELRPTEKCWKLLRKAYRRFVKAKVRSDRDAAEGGEERDDEEAEGSALVGAGEGEAKKKRVYWTEEEDAHLRQAIELYGTGRWTHISANVKELGRHTSQEIRNRWRGYTRNRKVKLRVVSGEKLREMEMEESETAQPAARGAADSTQSHVPGKRPYPANVMEMDEHMRYNAVGRRVKAAAAAVAPPQSDAVKEDAHGGAAVKSVEGEAAAADKAVAGEEAPLQQFYSEHRHVSVRISPTVTLPLPVLRRYLCDVTHMAADGSVRLLKDMCDETDEEERRRLLSEAVYAQMLADSKRSALISEIDQYCTQMLRKDRRVRWATQLAAYQQLLQAAAAAAAAARSAAAADSAVGAEEANANAVVSPSPALDAADESATAPVVPLQVATPVRKQYKLPAAAFASPSTAVSSAEPDAQNGTVQMTMLSVESAEPVVPPAEVTPSAPARLRKYTIPSVPPPMAAPDASAVPAVETSTTVSPLLPVTSAVDAAPLPVAEVPSPAALAARIQRPPPLPPSSTLSSPSSSAASSSSLTSPPPSASNRRANQQRGPYFTSRKRVALAAARDAVRALIASGALTPKPNCLTPIDDRLVWTDYDRAKAEAVAPGNIEDFTPAGIPLSAMLRLVDDKVLDEQKRRAERRQQGHAARARDVSGTDEQQEGEEEETGSQVSLTLPSPAETKEEQRMDTSE